MFFPKGFFLKLVNSYKNNTEKRMIRIYPTLRCNLRCSYCVNNYDLANNKIKVYSELSFESWLRIIGKTNCKTVIITGGEPTIYKDFYSLVNNMPEEKDLRIYSNLSFDPFEFVKKIKRKIYILGSYHPCSRNFDKIIKCIGYISASPLITGEFRIIDTNENKKFIYRYAHLFSGSNWKILFGKDQRNNSACNSQRFKKKVICKRKIVLIAPDGVRYPCVAGMVSKRWLLEDLTREDFKKYKLKRVCDNWGYCAPCDGLGNNKVKFLI